jgi:hypothetical protein
MQNNNETINERVIKQAEALQDEMHAYIDNLRKSNPMLKYDTCQTIYLLLKLSEIKTELRQIKNAEPPL